MMRPASSNEHSWINWSLLAPCLVSAGLLQAVLPLMRIGTTYRALNAGLSAFEIGAIGAAFALLPIPLTFLIGRYIDRGGAVGAVMAGAVLTLAAGVLLLVVPSSFAGFVILSSLLGIGQTFIIISMQFVMSLSSSADRRESALGNYMIALSVGQLLGPLALTFVDSSGNDRAAASILLQGAGGALLLLFTSAFMVLRIPSQSGRGGRSGTVDASIWTPALVWIVITSSLCVTAADLLIIYLPVLGAERSLDVSVVGWLLGIRAAGSMSARLFYARFVEKIGRSRALLLSMVSTGLSIALLMMPMPVWAMAVMLAVAGGGIGFGIAATLSLTITMAPPNAQAIAMSVRLTANRIGQFAIPLAAGAVATTVGTGAIFMVTGLALCVSAVVASAKSAALVSTSAE